MENEGSLHYKMYKTIRISLEHPCTWTSMLGTTDFEELREILFLASYISNVSIIGDACAIASGGGLVLVVPSISKCVSSHDPLKSELVISEDICVPSYLDSELAHDVFVVDFKVVGLGLECASFDIIFEGK
ncbi:hypothetical protein M9H77_03746 [Catharanthus roseus]|uniref:Uncharacterized protein n=1 Tax=Catharanthus roseus TaxID=4058 RepID=A0ACC0CCI7_CATRO|nr:hypothetical protein M9H77_03746 [Catharanthus roseus]